MTWLLMQNSKGRGNLKQYTNYRLEPNLIKKHICTCRWCRCNWSKLSETHEWLKDKVTDIGLNVEDYNIEVIYKFTHSKVNSNTYIG